MRLNPGAPLQLARSNFKALLARIKYVNETVVELNNATTASVNNMNGTVNSLDAFYAASPSPLTFNSDIDTLSAKLVMPSDTNTLQTSATGARPAALLLLPGLCPVPLTATMLLCRCCSMLHDAQQWHMSLAMQP